MLTFRTMIFSRISIYSFLGFFEIAVLVQLSIQNSIFRINIFRFSHSQKSLKSRICLSNRTIYFFSSLKIFNPLSCDEDEAAEVVTGSRTTATGTQQAPATHPPTSIGQIETGPIESVLMEHRRRIQEQQRQEQGPKFQSVGETNDHSLAS